MGGTQSSANNIPPRLTNQETARIMLVNLDSNVENVRNEQNIVNNNKFTHNGLQVNGNFHDIQNN